MSDKTDAAQRKHQKALGECAKEEPANQNVSTPAPCEDQTKQKDNTSHVSIFFFIPYSYSVVITSSAVKLCVKLNAATGFESVTKISPRRL